MRGDLLIRSKPHRIGACLFALVVAACGTPRQPAPQTPGPESAATSQPPAWESILRSPGRLSSRIDRRKIASQLVSRPLSVATRCSFRNETGYNGEAKVAVAGGDASLLNVAVNLPSQGQCLFDMAGFRQLQRGAMVELRHPADGCTARLWEQGQQVTVAFSNCAARCSPAAAFQYVWPVLIDRSSGRCD